MGYHYEELGPDRFQELAQSLIIADFPDQIIQCLPTGQPDGGRDGVAYPPDGNDQDFVVFQVKFSRAPAEKNERDAVTALIRTEKSKVDKLVAKGARKYVFITNIKGTAHLDTGSIDRVNSELSDAFGIPTEVWWRDDLDRRVDSSSDIKWSYLDICRATDMLQYLLAKENESELEATNAITAYFAQQYSADRDVKFKQVDLTRRLTDLFVDLPIGPKLARTSEDREHRYVVENPETIAEYAQSLRNDRPYDFGESGRNAQTTQAGTFFLHMPFFSGVSRVVLEGAPGQGKSTVTQYICQINRLRLLKKSSELEKVIDLHRTGPVRAPFRVDLRDYARWTSGHHPFSKGADDLVPPEGQRSLESFLAMQVSHHAGGLKIGHPGLIKFLQRAHSIIVLDGFDEVADIAIRGRVVEEICKFSDRMDGLSLSLQVIVTSRPAAFANSPGFPEDDWLHLKLKNLGRKNVDAYREKWSEAQALHKDERLAVETTLGEKLTQPHIRELARNPMQLAILLHLIHVQGHGLPDKRTTLYEEYMKLFFNREVEKSEVVREHRELLLSIHGVLAWRLQTQAEEGSGSGSITRQELKTCVREYLEIEEYDITLADSLVRGTMERVGALVSRVEGTFEFEVQPLREYFTAWHLYKTANYSPAGSPKSGTKPDRFDALARNFYWTNVTRFFCGFYDKGELSSLLDGLVQLEEQNGYELVNQPRNLAIMLLIDQVFAQSPRITKQLIQYLIEEPGFRRLTSSEIGGIGDEISLPEMAGRDALFDAALSKLGQELEPCRQRTLRRLIARNSTSQRLKDLLSDRLEENSVFPLSITEAEDFGLVGVLSEDDVRRFTEHNVELRLDWFLASNSFDEIHSDLELASAARDRFFRDNLTTSFDFHGEQSSHYPIDVLGALLASFVLNEIFSDFRRYSGGPMVVLSDAFGIATHEMQAAAKNFNVFGDLGDLAKRVVILTSGKQKNWSTQWQPWKELVDLGYGFEPKSSLFTRIAFVSTCADEQNHLDEDPAIKEKDVLESVADSRNPSSVGEIEDTREAQSPMWNQDGFAPTQGLVERLQFAKAQSDDLSWWAGQLEELDDHQARLIGLTMFCLSASPKVIAGYLTAIETMLSTLDQKDWLQLVAWVCSIPHNKFFEPFSGSWFANHSNLSDRLSFVLSRRIERDPSNAEERQKIGRLLFSDCKNDAPFILREAAALEMSVGAEKTMDYEYLSKLSQRARNLDMDSFASFVRLRKATIPKEVALSGLACCEMHCSQWIAACESAYSEIIARSASKVSDVAKRDDWFAVN
ncbi:NACHT domain-containing protein [Sulfitobacter sp. 1A16787]|uniref:NACHT domain-containing protein n=1 Tax=Sulfitobacter sp. 1A16787 TaxID=3368571 RepID=UPI00374501BB